MKKRFIKEKDLIELNFTKISNFPEHEEDLPPFYFYDYIFKDENTLQYGLSISSCTDSESILQDGNWTLTFDFYKKPIIRYYEDLVTILNL